MAAIKIVNSKSTHNTTLLKNRDIKYIVVHYSAGVSSATGNALSMAKYFGTSEREASADFICDDATIVQYNADIKNRYCWSVGGSKYTSLQTSEAAKYYGKCTNANSISIEMCSNKKNTSTLSVYDNDWSVSSKTVAKCKQLVQYLMKTYGISANNVIMHHHVTGKWCPQPWCKNEAALSNWRAFKKSLGAESSAKSNASSSTNASTAAGVQFLIKVHGVSKGDVLNIRSSASVSGKITGKLAYNDPNKYTIVQTKSGWGKLKSGIGWINLSYTKKVQ